MKKVILLITLALVSAQSLKGMEVSQPGSAREYMATLPKEIQISLIPILAKSKTLETATAAIRGLTETNQTFNNMINDSVMTRTLIRMLALNFNVPSGYVAKKLSTKGSMRYVALSLELITALWEGDTTKAEQLIKAGADVDFQTADTYPLWCGSTSNIISLAEMNNLIKLLSLAANESRDPVEIEQSLTGIELTEFKRDLLESKLYMQETTMNMQHIFANHTQLNQVLTAIDNNNFQEALDIIKQRNPHNGIALHILRKTDTCIIGAGFSLLMYTIASRKPTLTSWLIEHGANPNLTMSTGETALLMAISMGNPDKMVQLLIDKGSKVNQQNRVNEQMNERIFETLGSRNSDDVYDKITISMNNHYFDNTLYKNLKHNALKAIMWKGIEMPGATPLIRLVDEVEIFDEKEFNELFNLLLSKKANLNIQDADGDTALFGLAFTNGHADYMQLLLDHGADPAITDNEGLTALDHLNNYQEEHGNNEENNDPQIKEKIAMLEAAMAKQKK